MMTTKSKAPSGAASSPAKRAAAKAVVQTRATTPTAAKAVKPAVRTVARKATVKAATQVVSKAVSKAVAAPSVPVSTEKLKLVRDSFSFPAHEHALLAELKKRALKMGREFKKSEILRAGITHLAAMTDNVLLAALSKVERVKTGRPSKKNKKK